jgi:hypothetical protein
MKFKSFLNGMKHYVRAIIRMPLVLAGLAFNPGDTKGTPVVNTENLRNELREYFEAHSEGNGIWKFDHYFDFYHRYLSKFINAPITLLEIGIYSGGSLPMWRKFFGPSARIWGVDIEPACASYASEGIEVFIGSQADREFLAGIRPNEGIDVCIDDGSHVPEHQITSFEAIFPRLNPGGVYICEDIHGCHNRFHDYLNGLIKGLNTMMPSQDKFATPASNLQRWVRAVHVYPYAVVIEKREGEMAELRMQKKGSVWQPFSAKSK